MQAKKKPNKYSQVIEAIFMAAYTPGETLIPFGRTDLEDRAIELGLGRPKNLGDVLYSFRYRNPLPDAIIATQPEGKEWIISGAGRAQYAFQLVTESRITPNPDAPLVKIPDATPEMIRRYEQQGDEQALLAGVRYNRLIDLFLGLTAYSLQNHLRTTLPAVGQIEIDELYVGVDGQGVHYVIPVQAKGGNDQIGVVQVKQDLDFCKANYEGVVARSVAVQFARDGVIAMFELTLSNDEVEVVREGHFKLASADEITTADLARYVSQSDTTGR